MHVAYSWYGDSIGDITVKNFSTFSLIQIASCLWQGQ